MSLLETSSCFCTQVITAIHTQEYIVVCLHVAMVSHYTGYTFICTSHVQIMFASVKIVEGLRETRLERWYRLSAIRNHADKTSAKLQP